MMLVCAWFFCSYWCVAGAVVCVKLALYESVAFFTIRVLRYACRVSCALTVCAFDMRGRFLFAEPPVQFVRVSVTLITSALYGVRRFSYSLTVCVCVCAFDMRGRFLFAESPL